MSVKQISSFFKKCTALILVSFVVGCASTQHGRPINFAKLERLSVGISTEETVKEVFGFPQEIEYPDNRTIFKYRYVRINGNDEVREGIDFVFNKRQRLIAITINDALDFHNVEGVYTKD